MIDKSDKIIANKLKFILNIVSRETIDIYKNY